MIALNEVALEVEGGSVVGIVGANGAGKSTLLNVLTGAVEPDSGSVHVHGVHMKMGNPDVFAGAGVARTFQKVRLFMGLTVEENVRVAMDSPHRWSPLSALFRTAAERERDRGEKQDAHELLAMVNLVGKRSSSIAALTYGERRLVEIARALARRPRLLLLDEPAAGMSRGEEEMLVSVLSHLDEDDSLTLMVVEHRWNVLRAAAHRVLWMSNGAVVADGLPDEVFARISAAAENNGGDHEPRA